MVEWLRALIFHLNTALNHLIISPLSGVGSSPAQGRCETSQVLLVGVPGGFSRVSLFLLHLLIGRLI